LQRDRSRVDHLRCVVTGKPHWVPTDQHLAFVVAAQSGASAAAGTGLVSARAGAARATHVAYDVSVAGYLELSKDTATYEPRSACCQAGHPVETCAHGYVGRLMWGTGRAQYLVKVSATAEVAAGELVRASGGTRFRRVNQMRFRDTFFAYEVASAEALCRSVSPTDEVEPMTITAPNNCWAQVFAADGTRQSGAFQLPDAELCRKVARYFCDKVPGHVDCRATFGSGSKVVPIDLDAVDTGILPIRTRP
jgi:hypothetical protein